MKTLTLILALLAAPATAGCIGPETMGVCHGAATDFGTGTNTDGGYVRVGPGLEVQPNGYGMGVGRDQYGRPMAHHPLWEGEPGIFAPGGFGNIWIDN